VIFGLSIALSIKVITMEDERTLDIVEVDHKHRLAQLYEDAFPFVARFVATRSGSFEDAKDIFHDSLVIFYEKSVAQQLPAGIANEKYIVGIAKHLWLRKFHEDHRKAGLDEMEEGISVPEEYFDQSDNRLLSVLQLTGRKCLALLRAFYYDNMAIREVTNTFGFSNEHSASVQKYKCIEKMRATVQQKSLKYEDLA
jgi:DNA-directed RNA polymerase specialized sigma24 family protein